MPNMSGETARPFIDPQQAIQDLRAAVEYLDTHGWIQGQDFDIEGGCCAFGAIRGVTGDDNGKSRSLNTMTRCSNASRAFYRVMGVDITRYNDVKGRTKAEVINALETVAAALEKDPRRA